MGSPLTASLVQNRFKNELGIGMNLSQVKKYLKEGGQRELLRETVVYFDGRPSKRYYELITETFDYGVDFIDRVQRKAPRKTARAASLGR
jgi:hypothetical protein